MNEVIEKLCRIKTQYAINRLNPSSTDMIFIQYEELCLELNKQLQAYKDKEEHYYKNREIKIRNILNSHNYLVNNNEPLKSMSTYILQILNEGDK